VDQFSTQDPNSDCCKLPSASPRCFHAWCILLRPADGLVLRPQHLESEGCLSRKKTEAPVRTRSHRIPITAEFWTAVRRWLSYRWPHYDSPVSKSPEKVHPLPLRQVERFPAELVYTVDRSSGGSGRKAEGICRVASACPRADNDLRLLKLVRHE